MAIVVTEAAKSRTVQLVKREVKDYEYRKGDLFVDGSKEKGGKRSVVKYRKAFQFLLRKVGDEWLVLALGG